MGRSTQGRKEEKGRTPPQGTYVSTQMNRVILKLGFHVSYPILYNPTLGSPII